MHKVLITGATGGLGAAVAQKLQAEQADVNIAVMVRDAQSEKAQALAKQGFTLRTGDYSKPDSLAKAFEGIDVLYFVSGNDMEAREAQQANVVSAAKAAQIGHIVYTSVALKDLKADAPLFGSMQAHIKTEAWIRDSGIAYTIMRHNLYSEVIAMFLGSREQLLASKSVFLPAGEGKTAFVPRDELAEAGAKVLANPEVHANKVYELNGSDLVRFAEIAQYLTALCGQQITYTSPEVRVFEETLTARNVPAAYIHMMTAFGLAIADGVFDIGESDLELLIGRKSGLVKDYIKQAYQA